MSVPNSILWVLLVVVWLFVLVPIFVNRRPKVLTVSQAALNTRVLFRGGFDKLKHRIRPQSPAPGEYDHEDEDEADTTRRPVAEVFATDHEEDLEVADEAEFVEDDAPRRRHEHEIVDDAEIVAVEDVEASTRHHHDEDEDGEAADEDQAYQLSHRSRRGGFDPEADASARAHRYAVRQRIVLGLLVALVVSAVLSFSITPAFWYAAGALTAVLAGYLFYLRQQVHIEEQIRMRRMARYARSRHGEGEEPIERHGPDERGPSQRPQPKPRAPRVVAVDEDNPDFVELRSPNEGRLRRASGE